MGELDTIAVTTRSGERVVADIWFRCFGALPARGYVATARHAGGHLDVTPQLRLNGQERLFAIGDITATAEAKTAKAAGQHAEVVATNIRTLIEGRNELAAYTPDPPGISLPLGPDGGASYAAHIGILDADATSELKGADLRTEPYIALLGLARGPRNDHHAPVTPAPHASPALTSHPHESVYAVR